MDVAMMTYQHKKTRQLDAETSIVTYLEDSTDFPDKKQGIVWVITLFGCPKYKTKPMTENEALLAVEIIADYLEEDFLKHKAVSSLE